MQGDHCDGNFITPSKRQQQQQQQQRQQQQKIKGLLLYKRGYKMGALARNGVI